MRFHSLSDRFRITVGKVLAPGVRQVHNRIGKPHLNNTENRPNSMSPEKAHDCEPWVIGMSHLSSPVTTAEMNWLAWVLLFLECAETQFARVENDHVRFLSGTPTSALNAVAWGGGASTHLEARVREITRLMKQERGEHGSPVEWWLTGTQPDRVELEAALRKNGWTESYRVPGMSRDLTDSMPSAATESGWSLEHVRTPDHVSKFLSPIIEGFHFHEESRPYLQSVFGAVSANERHPMQNFLFSCDGEAVTSGSIMYRYGVAVIYNICTLKHRQRCGGASMMVKHLMWEAKRAGYREVSLFALPEGQPVYERLGFKGTSGLTIGYRME